ncbi:Hpt domain-containing protein [Cereibacter sphaeroides]|uniref:Hpt domain-containing protein n=1 Tax=Rhodobacterales TaxID=204455 RepID=UPI000BBE8E9E|nr:MULTISPECIES: Hpt domain-containing protein [Paracoccaceae]MCE6961040.1 Hpt domain-containing protein [Cereibacter sphaeroides]MCE6969662.1 Hpt domain-containing protein [Cereibacter sphaeroides]MCE6975137.1 Hpt domain-containing protein [Cereibacter sphaeroides]
MIDWARVADLRGEVGTEGFDEVVTMFMEETDETIRRLNGRREDAGLEELLHFLKGSALNLGFTTVSRLCQEGERLAAAGRGSEVDLVQLTDSYRNTRHEFLLGLRQLPPI